MAEPLYRLIKKTTPWKWGEKQQAVFQQLKTVLSLDQVLVHFDPDKPVGPACDAMLELEQSCFIAIRTETSAKLPTCLRLLWLQKKNYSKIHKEALAIIFGLRKFYQFLYSWKIILVTDHKPLTALFGPKKGTTHLEANRLARWALWLSQFDYTIEYRKTTDHGNGHGHGMCYQSKNCCLMAWHQCCH